MPAWLNLPNAITLLRLILTPFIIQAIVGRRPAFAMALFITAAVTDVLDGAAARRLRLSTPSGAYFDPVADKCLLSGVFLALAAGHFVPWWFVAIVFGRDICILMGVGIFFFFTPIRSFPPSIWGKMSTFVQISTAVVWMARNMLTFPLIDALATAMLWVSTTVTIWSGLDYARRGLQLARTH